MGVETLRTTEKRWVDSLTLTLTDTPKKFSSCKEIKESSFLSLFSNRDHHKTSPTGISLMKDLVRNQSSKNKKKIELHKRFIGYGTWKLCFLVHRVSFSVHTPP